MHYCVQMLIFKQAYQMHLLGLVLMKSLAGADRDSSEAFGSAELKSRT